MANFPGVDWYCDECDDWLNAQSGFNDGEGSWICAACGHSNTISSDMIISDDDMQAGQSLLMNFDPDDYK